MPNMLFKKPHTLFAASLLCLPAALPPLLAAPRAAASASSKPALKAAAKAPAAAEYTINPGDEIEIRVRNHTDLNRVFTVRPDGRITFPRAGEVQAVGRTPEQLAGALKAALERTLNNVGVEVEIKAAKARQVRVNGAVKSPSPFYNIAAGWRVLDAIAAAGGLSAPPSRISGRVVRATGEVPFDVALAVAQPRSAANILLQPDDLILLDESQVPNQITVTGQVAKPGVVVLSEGLSLSSVLAQAGGVAPGAALRQAHVLRNGAKIPLDLSGVDTPAGVGAATAAFRFQVGDVLLVPENTARVNISGQVVRPAFYPLPEQASDATLLQVLASAGGLAPGADGRAATLTRIENGERTTKVIDLEAMAQGLAPDNVILRADDSLFVPRQTAQVRAIGQVTKPGAYPLTENMTLLSLVAEAGVSATATGLGKAYVQREGKQLPVDLQSVLVEGKSNDAIAGFKLQRDDVLVVPNVSAQVYAIGQITRPGAYALDDKLSLPALIAQAGNATAGAALDKAYVRREGQQIPLDLQSLLVRGQADASTVAFRFQAGDVLVLPEKPEKGRFAVIGQVTRPSYYPYPDDPRDATVFKALAQAGGPAGTGDGGADLGKAHIIRTVNGQQVAIPVNLQNMVQSGGNAASPTAAMVLQPEDVLFIPTRKRGFRLTDALGILGPLSILAR